MFETIIVGVDGREGGRDALALAGMLQRKFASAAKAVIAYPHDPFIGRASSRAIETSVARDAIQAAHDDVRCAAVHARVTAVPDSSAARALHHAAEGERADLIVVGSDRRGPVSRVLAGDVTSGALNGAPCPVAVAPRRACREKPGPAPGGRRL